MYHRLIDTGARRSRIRRVDGAPARLRLAGGIAGIAVILLLGVDALPLGRGGTRCGRRIRIADAFCGGRASRLRRWRSGERVDRRRRRRARRSRENRPDVRSGDAPAARGARVAARTAACSGGGSQAQRGGACTNYSHHVQCNEKRKTLPTVRRAASISPYDRSPYFHQP